MYFTDTPELRKFEREMRQKPNFDRRNTEIRKRLVDFMTIKIRSPTQKTMQLNNLTLGDV